MVAYPAAVPSVAVDEPMTGSAQGTHGTTDRQEPMAAHTIYAPQVALPATAARPCATAHGDQWRVRMGNDMGLGFMNSTSIKRPARRLGKRAT